jgi:hypothetical protein
MTARLPVTDRDVRPLPAKPHHGASHFLWERRLAAIETGLPNRGEVPLPQVHEQQLDNHHFRWLQDEQSRG